MLSGLEVLIMVLLYALTLPSSMSLIHKHRKYHYSYRTSLEDVMGFSLARALLLSFAYAWGAKRHQHRCVDQCCMRLGSSAQLASWQLLYAHHDCRDGVHISAAVSAAALELHLTAAAAASHLAGSTS